MNTKVLLVDDHPLMRNGLRQMLVHSGFDIIGEASTGEIGFKLAMQSNPDLIFVDMHLPDKDGVGLIGELRQEKLSAKLIAFTGDLSRSLVDEALKAGVNGYISKMSSPEEILRAVQIVLAGKIYLSAELSSSILEDYRKSLTECSGNSKVVLSERDKKLLELIAQGRRNKEIATELNLKDKSVEAYRARLMKRLGYSTSAELVRYAIREGIATL